MQHARQGQPSSQAPTKALPPWVWTLLPPAPTPCCCFAVIKSFHHRIWLASAIDVDTCVGDDAEALTTALATPEDQRQGPTHKKGVRCHHGFRVGTGAADLAMHRSPSTPSRGEPPSRGRAGSLRRRECRYRGQGGGPSGARQPCLLAGRPATHHSLDGGHPSASRDSGCLPCWPGLSEVAGAAGWFWQSTFDAVASGCSNPVTTTCPGGG